MEVEHVPETIVALYARLADAEAALLALQDAGVPYPDIRMTAHTPGDLEGVQLADVSAPQQFWSLAVLLEPKWRDKALEVLEAHRPFATGRMPAANAGRGDADRGAIAWRHYVFWTPAATDIAGDGAGTTGMTGVISSGVFATGAQAEGNPPANAIPAHEQRPAGNDKTPTTDERRPIVEPGDSRPETKLKP
jgi:hypothetical protein